MPRPLLPTRRLLRLRERIENVAKHELQHVQASIVDEEAALERFGRIEVQAVATAEQWLDKEALRDASRARLHALQNEREQREQVWVACKRERRQAEMLLQKRLNERHLAQQKEETRAQQDWASAWRARAAHEES